MSWLSPYMKPVNMPGMSPVCTWCGIVKARYRPGVSLV